MSRGFFYGKGASDLRLVLVAIGGAFGAVTRYLVDGWIMAAGPIFPLGTLVINVSGSFALGFFYTLAVNRFFTPPGWRLVIAIGFLGAYTTFSTFSYETFKLIENGSILMALLNIMLSVAGVLVALYLGNLTGRLL